jgi:hypothetical protein
MALHKFVKVDTKPREAVFSWVDKYKPKCIEEMKCNSNSVKKVYEWCMHARGKKNQVLLLIGPHGCGKSLGVELALRKAGIFVIVKDNHEIRNKPFIEELNHISANENHNTAVVIENIDMNSKGIMDFVKGVSKDEFEKFPPKKTRKKVIGKDMSPLLILVSNNTYGAVNSIVEQVDTIYFTTVPSSLMVDIAKDIFAKEGRPWSLEVVKRVIQKSVGDVRYFILQLEFLCTSTKDDSFFVIKRLEHVSIFNACEEFLNEKNLGPAKGCYLASIDTSMMPCLIFENYGVKFTESEFPFLSKVSELISDIDLMQSTRNSELVEMMTYLTNLPCRRGSLVAKDLKYPSIFAKLHLEHSYTNYTRKVETKVQPITIVPVHGNMFADFVVRLIQQNEMEFLSRVIFDYKLVMENIQDMIKMCNLRKITLKAKVKTTIQNWCKPFEMEI